MKYAITLLLAAMLAAPMSSCKLIKGSVGSGLGGEEVLLRYNFPEGAVLKYRVEEEAIKKFSVSVMPAYQQTRARSNMLISETVMGSSMGDYFTIRRKIEDANLKIWRSNNLIYDSSNPSGFDKIPSAEDFEKLKDRVIKMELNRRGEIRNISGLGEVDFGAQPMQSMQKLETGNPLLPEKKVSVGKSWKAESSTPFPASQGYRGILEVEKKVTLSDLTTMDGSRVAVLTEQRQLSMKMYRTGLDKPWKGFSGRGEARGKFFFDIDNGRVIKGDMNTDMEISTRVSSAGSKIDTTVKLNIISSYELVDK